MTQNDMYCTVCSFKCEPKLENFSKSLKLENPKSCEYAKNVQQATKLEPTVKFNYFATRFDVAVQSRKPVQSRLKAVQSRLATVVIVKKDARLTLNNKRSGQQSSSCHGKSAAHSATRQYNSRVFINSSQQDTTGVVRKQINNKYETGHHPVALQGPRRIKTEVDPEVRPVIPEGRSTLRKLILHQARPA